MSGVLALGYIYVRIHVRYIENNSGLNKGSAAVCRITLFCLVEPPKPSQPAPRFFCDIMSQNAVWNPKQLVACISHGTGYGGIAEGCWHHTRRCSCRKARPQEHLGYQLWRRCRKQWQPLDEDTGVI